MSDMWAKPQSVDDVMLAFPASVVGALLPTMEEIPDDFKGEENEWVSLQAEWFFRGIDGEFVPKDGIDTNAALRHLACCQKSFEPSHENKRAGVAWLMSQWFVKFNRKES